MNNKKIIFLINKLGIGGAERVFIKDVNLLKEKGIDVYFAFLFGDTHNQTLLSDLNLSESNLFYCKAKNVFDLGALRRLSGFLKENKIKNVYSTLNESNIFSRFLKFFNKCLYIYIREANIADPKPFKFKLLDIIFNYFTAKIICVSEEVKDSLIKYQPFYKNKFEVLMNGVDIPESYKNYKQKIDLPINMLSVGSLTPKKDHALLIRSLASVDKEIPNSFLLTIIGDGVLEKEITDLVINLGLKDKIKIIKPVSKSELSRYYLDSDLFILSSKHEGCPNVLLEACAHGLASISTMVSGAVDIIDDGISGRLVPVGSVKGLSDAISYIINNRESVLSKWGTEARKKMIEKYSLEKHIEKLISIIN